MLPGDNPIKKAEEDVLVRNKLACGFVQQVLNLDTCEGTVVGILGPWGSGKTSIINLTRPEFKRNDVPIIDFNPWMFSGAHQLVDSFFIELAAQLKMKPGLDKISERIVNYGEMFSGMTWVPIVGPWIERGRHVTKIFNKIIQRRKQGIEGQRKKLEAALAALNKPIVVVLDDIDRLSTDEIRDIFKLVRLTASFPKIIYILAFDRFRVEEALSEQGIPGRDYLEKILQVTIDLPAIPRLTLRKQLCEEIDNSLSSIEQTGPFNTDNLPSVLNNIVLPLIKNMRDVRRYAMSIHGTVLNLDGQIELTDILALEAVRIFIPEAFAEFHRAILALTKPSSDIINGPKDPSNLKDQINHLVEIAKKTGHEDVMRSLIKDIFPAASRHIGGLNYSESYEGKWLREHRVAHEHNLLFFLERILNKGLTDFKDAEAAWLLMADHNGLDSFLRNVEKDHLQDVIMALEAYDGEFLAEQTVPSAVVLLNLLPDMPPTPKRHIFDFREPRLIVGRIIYMLLKSLNNTEEMEAAVNQIFPKINTLSSKFIFISIVGHNEKIGEKLISENVSKKLEFALRDEIRNSPTPTLSQETALTQLLLFLRRNSDPSEAPFEVEDNAKLTLSILNSAMGETRKQSSTKLITSPFLGWNDLIEIFRTEEILKDRIIKLKASDLEIPKILLELINKYLSGWRPKRLLDN